MSDVSDAMFIRLYRWIEVDVVVADEIVEAPPHFVDGNEFVFLAVGHVRSVGEVGRRDAFGRRTSISAIR